MLDELRAVLENCKPDAGRRDYLTAIHEDNGLGKRTASTRKLLSQRLSELYALDPEVLCSGSCGAAGTLTVTAKRFWRCC